MKPYLSIIIPVYNEEKRIENLIDIFQYLKGKKYTSEILLINDGSKDKTLRKLKIIEQKYKKNYPFKLISYQNNEGKGAAIRKGMLASSGKFRLFLDVDLSTPIEELGKFEKNWTKFDILIATRKSTRANIIKRQPFLREILGKCFTTLSQIVLGVKVSDFTCGFKCFSEKAALEIFSRQRIKRWGFDSEVLFIAELRGFKIKEIPVEWRDDTNTKVKFPQDIIKSLMDLYKIRYYYFKKRYN